MRLIQPHKLCVFKFGDYSAVGSKGPARPLGGHPVRGTGNQGCPRHQFSFPPPQAAQEKKNMNSNLIYIVDVCLTTP